MGDRYLSITCTTTLLFYPAGLSALNTSAAVANAITAFRCRRPDWARVQADRIWIEIIIVPEHLDGLRRRVFLWKPHGLRETNLKSCDCWENRSECMNLNEPLVWQNFRRISRILQSRFLSVMCVSQSRFLAKLRNQSRSKYRFVCFILMNDAWTSWNLNVSRSV